MPSMVMSHVFPGNEGEAIAGSVFLFKMQVSSRVKTSPTLRMVSFLTAKLFDGNQIDCWLHLTKHHMAETQSIPIAMDVRLLSVLFMPLSYHELSG